MGERFLIQLLNIKIDYVMQNNFRLYTSMVVYANKY